MATLFPPPSVSSKIERLTRHPLPSFKPCGCHPLFVSIFFSAFRNRTQTAGTTAGIGNDQIDVSFVIYFFWSVFQCFQSSNSASTVCFNSVGLSITRAIPTSNCKANINKTITNLTSNRLIIHHWIIPHRNSINSADKHPHASNPPSDVCEKRQEPITKQIALH